MWHCGHWGFHCLCRAFGVDQDGLEALLREGVFHLRTCKLCDDGVVVKGACLCSSDGGCG